MNMTQSQSKEACYQEALAAIEALIEGETDWVSVLSTVVCELHNRMDYFHWTGFYRLVSDPVTALKVGPYQGGHGCLTITLDRGVCSKAARTGEVQLIEDVNAIPHHIACSSSTQSEIVLPVRNRQGKVCAVLDVDSDHPAAFDSVDQAYLEEVMALLVDFAP